MWGCSSLCSSLICSSRPMSNLASNSSRSSNLSGSRKCRRKKSSSMRFCSGVPVRSVLWLVLRSLSERNRTASLFFRRWPSSTTIVSHTRGLSTVPVSLLAFSYVVSSTLKTTRACSPPDPPAFSNISDFRTTARDSVLPTYVTTFSHGAHFSNSRSQLRRVDSGTTTRCGCMQPSAVSAAMYATVCMVLPSPISSARMTCLRW
mmetsp:Transcript_25887/g.88579  ORF Transcript_25887/g.88579 Transcript_25887/m.88579 type:complete len:204 (-) Transcript_25887:182-793(-)